uniref:FBA_2 domain-containing protein n=1 Tax=Caenorhabditis tropicalis TaxID=1561998 RepID=A0A1I7TWU6_9PELO
MEGVRLITEYLCWFFQINISNVVITKYSNLVDPVAVIDWVIRRQNKLECLMIESKKAERTSDKTARDILSKINHSANVLINFDLSPNFKTSLKFEGKLLKIRNGHWFTLDNLFSVNCSILNVKRTFLDVGDMNEFLKHWIASDLKFKEINIKMTEVISDALFSEIEFVKQPKDVERVYKSYDGLTTIYGGYDIQRNDGLWATIDSNRFEESIDFRMIIWDEQEQ